MVFLVLLAVTDANDASLSTSIAELPEGSRMFVFFGDGASLEGLGGIVSDG